MTFVYLQFGNVQEMSPRVFNTNCTADVFMTFVKRIIIEEVGEYCVNKQGLLQAKIDELDMEIQNCELSITRFESTEGGEENKLAQVELMKQYQQDKVVCQKNIDIVMEGNEMFQGLEDVELDIVEKGGLNRKFVMKECKKRVMEILSKEGSYSAVKIDTDEEGKERVTLLEFKLE